MSLRDSTYKLCNYLRRSIYSVELKNVIDKLNKSNNENINSGHFGYVARHHTLQFLSYLYVNQNYLKMNQLMAPFNLTPLNEKEINIFEKGHNLLLKINKIFKDELFKILPNAASILEVYQKVNVLINSNDIIDLPISYIDEITQQFLTHSSFNVIRNSIDQLPKIKEIPKEQLIMGVDLLLKEINQGDFFEVPETIRKMNHMLPIGHLAENINRVIRALACLKISTQVFNQLIYQAAKNEKLSVLDNSNIFRIVKHINFYLGEVVKLEVQPNRKCNSFELPLSCCYLNIEVRDDYKIKDLFWIANNSFSFGHEIGNVGKYWLRKIDTELNYLIDFNKR